MSSVSFILHKPQLSENIGACARAIKNFSITKLRIINPRCKWPNQKALATAVGAKDVLKLAKVYDSIEKSIGDLDIIFASTSRIRKINKKIISILDLKNKLKKKRKIALIRNSMKFYYYLIHYVCYIHNPGLHKIPILKK